jgi:hypothetical protein
VFLVHAGLFPVEPSEHPGTAFGSEPLKGGLSFLATAGVGVVELRDPSGDPLASLAGLGSGPQQEEEPDRQQPEQNTGELFLACPLAFIHF